MTARLDALVAWLAARQPVEHVDAHRRQAAVALILAPDPDQLLLIHRAQREGDPWSGHLALPGGRRDAADADLLTTAIRETVEETGLVLTRDACVGVLDDLAPRTPSLPPVMVRPFVFRLGAAAAAATSDEVVATEWVSLATLARAEVYGRWPVSVGDETREVAGYRLSSGLLWGMTERIVTPVVAEWAGRGGR